jgi:hypothetical protein
VHANPLLLHIEVHHVYISISDDTEFEYLKISLYFNNLYYLFILCHIKLVLWREKLYVIILVPYDAVNHNKASTRQLPFISFSLTTCFGPYGPSSGEIHN